MLLYIIRTLETKHHYTRERTNKILLWLGISLIITYGFAWFFDALFHFFESGKFEGGITFISGMLGGVGSFALLNYCFNREERGNILNLLNLIIPGMVLAHAFGRLGCFSVGCCYGTPTDSIFGIYFPEGTMPYDDGIRTTIHPTQLYEAFFLFVLFFLLTKISFFRKNCFPTYLIFYGIFRAILEIFFRGDSRGMLFSFPPSFVLSCFLILLGCIILSQKYCRTRGKV